MHHRLVLDREEFCCFAIYIHDLYKFVSLLCYLFGLAYWTLIVTVGLWLKNIALLMLMENVLEEETILLHYCLHLFCNMLHSQTEYIVLNKISVSASTLIDTAFTLLRCKSWPPCFVSFWAISWALGISCRLILFWRENTSAAQFSFQPADRIEKKPTPQIARPSSILLPVFLT